MPHPIRSALLTMLTLAMGGAAGYALHTETRFQPLCVSDIATPKVRNKVALALDPRDDAMRASESWQRWHTLTDY